MQWRRETETETDRQKERNDNSPLAMQRRRETERETDRKGEMIIYLSGPFLSVFTDIRTRSYDQSFESF